MVVDRYAQSIRLLLTAYCQECSALPGGGVRLAANRDDFEVFGFDVSRVVRGAVVL